MGWWKQIWTTTAQDWIFDRLDSSQVPGGAQNQIIGPESAYITVRLASMRVVNLRKGLSTFYGTVQSHISLPHLGGKPAAFDVVVTPTELKKVDPKHVDRVIVVNKKLLGPVPYRGGDLEMEVGLFSIKQADLLAPYLELLESLSDAAGVTYVKAALPFAQPIIKGIQLLTGSDSDDILEIGISSNQEPPSAGYYLAMRAPKGSVNIKSLRVTDNDMRLVNEAGKPVGNYPYMLLEVSASKQRNTWFEIEDLKVAYDSLRESVREGKTGEATERFAAFKRAAYTSDDLLLEDAKKIADEVDALVKSALGEPITTGAVEFKGGRELPDLESIKIYM